MTNRKRAEDEIKRLRDELEERVRNRTAQLQNINKELEAFSYSVSHDLRAPLRHIHAYVELLKENLGQELSGETRFYLEHIASSAGKMEQLIKDLLTFSRMGRAEIRRTSVDIQRLIQESLGEFHEEMQGRHIDWVIGELPEAKGDSAMLRQVILNLISNALKYTRGQPHARIEIGSTQEDRETVFFIRDNGVGFDMAFADRIFGVFQRLHSDKEFPGTGIGLAIVRRVIDRHGGRVWAEGTIGKGATFYFSLPKN